MSHLRGGVPGSQLLSVTWRKSSRSGPTGGNCVEIAALPGSARYGALHEAPGGAVAVRDSRQPDGPALIFTAATWRAFAGGLAAGLDRRPA
ncbi:MAG: DUF397 domain-containing protein [Streptosporangiaceae bacterium]